MPREVPSGLARFCSCWELGEQLAKFTAVLFMLLFKIRDDKDNNYKKPNHQHVRQRIEEEPFNWSES